MKTAVYKVRTIEYWRSQETKCTYEFESIFQMLKFIKMCKDDGIYFEFIKNNKSNHKKGA